MPIAYNADAFQFSHWICSKKSMSWHSYRAFGRCIQPELPGLLEDAEVSCLYRKEWFVSGWWEEKVRTLALQDPLAEKHSLPRIFSRPPASITAFLKKLEASRGRKIAWPQVGKSWQQRPGEDKGKKYRNRTQPLFQESLHQWRRKNSLVLLRSMNLFFSTYQKRHQSKCKNHKLNFVTSNNINFSPL